MKFGIQSDSSTAKSLTDRLGAGQRTKHIDTRYFWIQERVQDGDPSIKKVLMVEKLRRCWNEASVCFNTSTTLQFCRIGILLTMDPTLHHKMKARQPMMDLVTGLQNRCEHRDLGRSTSTETDSCQR